MIDSRRIELCLLIIWLPIRYVQMGDGGGIKNSFICTLFLNILIIFVWFCFILKEIGRQETENQPKKYRSNLLISIGMVRPSLLCLHRKMVPFLYTFRTPNIKFYRRYIDNANRGNLFSKIFFILNRDTNWPWYTIFSTQVCKSIVFKLHNSNRRY